jgi:5-hydroxyisourate hydrolase-like protein (transthyretin family)
MRTRRVLVALLGILAVAVLAPQFASADTLTGALSGTVTNSAQQPIAGIQVTATNVGTGNSYSTATGSDGTYTDGGLPPGSYQILFQPDNGQGQNFVYQYYPDKSNAAAAQAVLVSAGQTVSHVDATLATGATVSGKVTDAVTGAPVSGVSVYVDDYANGGGAHLALDHAVTDSTGAWSLGGYPTGTYEVRFSPSYGSNYAFQYWNQVTGQDPPTPIALTAGSTTSNVDAALAQGGQISGTVIDGTSGRPAQGVGVGAVDNSGNGSVFTTTDSAGHYTLSGLSPTTSYRVAFYPAGGSQLAGEYYPGGASLETATRVPVAAGQTTPNIDETLSEGASISGRVTDAATGYPLADVGVTLFDAAGRQVYPFNGGSTEADGTYHLTNLAPGTYRVKFSSEGALAFQYYASTLTLSAGQDVTNIDAALTPGGTLEGVVTDSATGEGLAEVSVGVFDSNGNYVSFGSTDPSGRYEIAGLAPGTYYVQFYPTYQGLGGNDQPEYYGGTPGLAGASPVTITAGKTTAGISIVLAPGSAASPSVSGQSTTSSTLPTITPPQTPVAVVTQVRPGPPTLFGGSLSGLGAGKPVLRFHLAAGANGHKLRSFKVKLPAGLAFVAAQLVRGVKVTGGGRVTEKVTGGQLVVTIGSPARAVTVTVASPAVKVTRARAGHAVRILVTVTPVNGTGHVLTFTVKNPT